MKKILKLSLVFAVLLTSIGTYAIDGHEDFLIHVKKRDGKVISFAVNGIQKMSLSIYDNNNKLIYSERATGKNGISKTYSLEEFPEGVYFLDVEDSMKKVRHEIIVTDRTSTLSLKAISAVYKTEFSPKNSSVVSR